MAETPPVTPVTPAPVLPWQVLPGLAVLVLLSFDVALVAAIMTKNEQMITVMTTATITLTSMAVGYFFQSSAGSAKKDDTISQQGAALATSTPPAPSTTTVTVP